MVKYTIELLSLENERALVDCVQKTFPEHEPMACALGLLPSDYFPYTELVCRKAVRDRMSFIAKETDSQKIVGFCINEDLATAPKYSALEISPKMLPLIELLEKLYSQFFRETQSFPRDWFHPYMLGILPDARGEGLAEMLMKQSLFFAKGLDYQRAVIEATGPYSQRLSIRLGFEMVHQISYQQYQYSGDYVFSGIQKVSHCQLLTKGF